MPMLLLLGAFLASCGGDGSGGGSSYGGGSPATTTTESAPRAAPAEPKRTARLTADESGRLAFVPDTVIAKAGKVTIELENPSVLRHRVAIRAGEIEETGAIAEPGGGSSTVSARLPPGEYEFFCPEPGHDEGGMHGTLSVR